MSLSAALIALLAPAGFAQTPPPDPGGMLGIYCDQPRRNADGKLILDDDGFHRARCEADRATALNYALVVRETRDRIRSALRTLPPPLWDDLVEHLRTRDDIDDWRYSDTGILRQFDTLSAGASPGNPGEFARYWAQGLLAGTTYPAAWRGIVRARACGTSPREAVLVWLDPGNIRDRWTAQMVQRTVRVRVQRTEGRNRLVDRIPDIVTASGQLRRYNGSERRNMPAGCPGVAPEGALAMRVTLRRDIETGRRQARCADPDQVGIRHLMWAQHNGVYIVPDRAILDDP